MLHDLRHTFASWLVAAGVNLVTVQHILGHASLAMAMRYAHLAPIHRPRPHLRRAPEREGFEARPPEACLGPLQRAVRHRIVTLKDYLQQKTPQGTVDRPLFLPSLQRGRLTQHGVPLPKKTVSSDRNIQFVLKTH